MNPADIDSLQRLFDLKSKDVITEAEYEIKKMQILSANVSDRDIRFLAHAPSRRLGHGVSLLVGSAVLILITVSLLSHDHPSQDDLDEAFGAVFLFGLWLVPHSIWLLTKRGANVVLPIIALALTGLCALSYAASL